MRPDSCGAGEFRGGLGLVRQYRILADDTILQVRADRTTTLPYGLFGGGPGAPSRNVLNPDTAPEDLPGKFTRVVGRDTVIRHEQAGGGGYGDPLKRDLAAIAADLRNGKISRDYAVGRGMAWCSPVTTRWRSTRPQPAKRRAGLEGRASEGVTKVSDIRTAVVTGGASGIGEACAERFAAGGWRVIIGDINAERGEAVAERLRAAGGDCRFIAVDVAER